MQQTDDFNKQHNKILSDAGWTLHLIKPELLCGYVVHQTTGQIVYIEFADNTEIDDDRNWEAIEVLITKHYKFDLNYQFRVVNG